MPLSASKACPLLNSAQASSVTVSHCTAVPQNLALQNQEVEQQLRTQEQLQQLAAAVGSATATAGGSGRPMGAAGLRGPPLVNAVATSPPNSQRKLLMHLTVSARPADAEVCCGRRGAAWGGLGAGSLGAGSQGGVCLAVGPRLAVLAVIAS